MDLNNSSSISKTPEEEQRRQGHEEKTPGNGLLEAAAGILGRKSRGVAQQNAPSFGVQLDDLRVPAKTNHRAVHLNGGSGRWMSYWDKLNSDE